MTQARTLWPRLIGEFAVIVIGVLVALGLEGWVEERADRALVRSYLGTLRTELEQDTLLNGIFLELHQRRAQGVRALLDDLNGSTPELSGADEFAALALAASGSPPLYATSMTEELLSTGNARLLDLSLLVAIQRVAARLQISRDVWDGLRTPLGDSSPGLVPGYMRRAYRDCARTCTDEEWAFDDAALLHLADSLLRVAPDAEVSAIRSWRDRSDIRQLLEEESYSAAAILDELRQDRAAILNALAMLGEFDR